MARYEDYKDKYIKDWEDLKIRSSVSARVRDVANKIRTNKAKYIPIQEKTGVPWWVIGLWHYRESDLDFGTYLGNGEPLGRRTRLVPRGRGPFKSFEEGAIDAIKIKGWNGAQDWSLPRVSYRSEAFNGFGYRKRGVNSPYLYGGSTIYGPPENKGGKYIRDHVFSSQTVDKQLGTLTILKKLMELDDSVQFTDAHEIVNNDEDTIERGTMWSQRALNKVGAADPLLVEDGLYGPKTKQAVSNFQDDHGLQATGLLDTATLDKLEEVLGAAEALRPTAQMKKTSERVAPGEQIAESGSSPVATPTGEPAATEPGMHTTTAATGAPPEEQGLTDRVRAVFKKIFGSGGESNA